MANEEPLVSLILGGVQKGGTSSLHSYLSQHPRLVEGARKELHFFDDEERVDWSAPDYAPYHRAFPPAPSASIRFESTPIYLYWPPSLARIHAYNPGIRLLLIFRDPIERAFSHWSMEYSRGAEDLPFSMAIRHGRWRLSGIKPLSKPWRVHSYVERGFYGRQVRNLLEHFPREQILFLRSDDLRNRQQATLAQVADFLGIEPFPTLAPRRDRTRPEMAYPSELTDEDVAYLAPIFLEDVKEFGMLTGMPINDWLVITSTRPASDQGYRG